MALFLTFEGGEGSGKSTQIKILAETLRKRGLPCLATREPGGTEIGTEIRRLLLDGKNRHLAPSAELLLYAADRAQHIHEIIRPALAEGRHVLCDRFADATLAYQGFGRGLDLELIRRLNALATGGLRPDLTFLLDLPVAIGLARAQSRLAAQNSSEGRFEAETLAFHEKVRAAYLQLAAEEPERFCVLDAASSIEILQEKILEKVEMTLRKGKT
ncbi:MAG TPA: dTMP kinase [Deltaproteobacteria bacterium]|nr:dTMP kinase [Deltaproteobacteria bacterium]